jgi:hypothetical protein
MEDCPNEDKSFSKFLSKITGHYPTPLYRKKLFYLVCIAVRLTILVSLVYLRDNKYVQYLYLLLSLLAVYNLYTAKRAKEWWSKNYQLLMSVLIAVSTALIIAGELSNVYMPLLFGISLLGGFLQSLTIDFC